MNRRFFMQVWKTIEHENWPAIASLFCAVIVPLPFLLFHIRQDTVVPPQSWTEEFFKSPSIGGAWLGAWIACSAIAMVLGLFGRVRSHQMLGRGYSIAIVGLLLGTTNCFAFPMWYQYRNLFYGCIYTQSIPNQCSRAVSWNRWRSI
jgi:hypothetical protein